MSSVFPRTALLFIVGVLLIPTKVGWGQSEKAQANQMRRAARSLALLAANGGGALIRQETDPASANPKLLSWLKQHQSAMVGAKASPFRTKKWGVATGNGNQLYLFLTAWPKSNKLTIPRLHNSIKCAMLMHNQAEVTVKPNVTNWELSLPTKPRVSETLLPVISIELDDVVMLGQATPPTVRPGDLGVIEVHARYSVVHGELLRFEPQAAKNCVGYWTKDNDWVEWRFAAKPKTTYELSLRYGCGDGEGGSEIEVKVGSRIFDFQVKATGGFQAWQEVKLGTVDGLQAENRLIVKTKKKAKNAVMDIQHFRLVPLAK